jgi:hypothetical protein
MSAAAFIGGVVGAVFLLIIYFTSRPEKGSREAAFANTEETKILTLEELPSLSQLTGSGSFVVRTLRQSGNPHQEDRAFGDSKLALQAAMSTFRRSKIEFVVVVANTPTELSFRRPWHDHRGRSEGKKVGWIEIHRV